jgi:hypothetical protein
MKKRDGSQYNGYIILRTLKKKIVVLLAIGFKTPGIPHLG